MLNQVSPCSITWSDFGYGDLKAIAKSHTLLDQEDDYRAYRDRVASCDKHCVPIFFLHERTVKSKVVTNNTLTRVIEEKRKKTNGFLYFDMEMNRSAAEELGKIYYCFVRM